MKIFLLLAFVLGSQAWAQWSVTTYNIRNFDHDYQAGRTDLQELGKTIKSFKSDVMGFIEVVNLPAFKDLITTNLPGYMLVNSKCGGGGRQKLSLAYNPKVFKLVSTVEDLSFSSSDNKCGGLRPALLVTLKHLEEGKNYVFAVLHLKAGGSLSAMQQRWLQYGLLESLNKKYNKQNIIFLGDLNTTGFNIKDEDYEQFDKFLKKSKLYTTSENLGCTSYWSGTLGNGFHQSSILDHIVLKETMASKVSQISLGSHCAKLDCRDATPEELGKSYQSVSDHCPIQVTFN